MFAFAAFLLLFAEESGQGVEQALKRFIDVFAAVEAEAADPINTAERNLRRRYSGHAEAARPVQRFLRSRPVRAVAGTREIDSQGLRQRRVDSSGARVSCCRRCPGHLRRKSGMSPGDEIVAINGIPLARLDTRAAGSAPQPVAQPASPSGRAPFRERPADSAYSDTRGSGHAERGTSIPSPSRRGLSCASAASMCRQAKQIKEAIEQLGGQNLKGLVLDLRNNPGGVVGAALETAALFLKPGQTIVSVRGQIGWIGRDQGSRRNRRPTLSPSRCW